MSGFYNNGQSRRGGESLLNELRRNLATISLDVVMQGGGVLKRKKTWGTNAFIFIWGCVFVGASVVLDKRFDMVGQYFGFIPALFFEGYEPWRLVTAGFLHSTALHIIPNCLIFWVTARLFERDRGAAALAAAFLLGSIGGCLLHGAFHMRELIPTIGASGGISAILGVYPALYRRSAVVLRVEPAVGMVPAVPLVWIWIVMQVVWSVLDRKGTTAYLTHMGGFAVGYCFGMTLKKFSRGKSDKPELRIVH